MTAPPIDMSAAYVWETVPAVAVVVYGLPAPQGSKSPAGMGRSRTTGKLIPLMRESSANVKPWREAVSNAITVALLQGKARRIAGPVYAQITFTMPKPETAPKRRRIYPAVSPDIDKVERATFDAITTSKAWEDDGRVIETHMRQVYPGEHPDALLHSGAVIRLYAMAKQEEPDP